MLELGGCRLQTVTDAARLVSALTDLPPAQEPLSAHVVIGGFGRVGQAIADILAAEHIEDVALDTNPELVSELRNHGKRVFFGDSGRRELLHRAGCRNAGERMVAAGRREKTKVPIIARARDLRHAERLKSLGAIGVVPEIVEMTLLLSERLLDVLGLPDAVIERRIERSRDELSASQTV